jgi:hypothetical protein
MSGTIAGAFLAGFWAAALFYAGAMDRKERKGDGTAWFCLGSIFAIAFFIILAALVTGKTI